MNTHYRKGNRVRCVRAEVPIIKFAIGILGTVTKGEWQDDGPDGPITWVSVHFDGKWDMLMRADELEHYFAP
jgi:hypothetical protein